MTSAYATGLYLRHQGAEGKRVFLIGEHGLAEEMSLAGLIVVPLESDERADYVVVGLDRFLTFAKLQRAFKEVRSRRRIRGHQQRPHLPDGRRQGDPRGRQHGRRAGVCRRHYAGRHRQTGAVHAGGNPAPGSGRPEDAVMIGDRLDTDIRVGRRVGLKTVLPLTGVTTPRCVGSLGAGGAAGLRDRFAEELPGIVAKLAG